VPTNAHKYITKLLYYKLFSFLPISTPDKPKQDPQFYIQPLPHYIYNHYHIAYTTTTTLHIQPLPRCIYNHYHIAYTTTTTLHIQPLPHCIYNHYHIAYTTTTTLHIQPLPRCIYNHCHILSTKHILPYNDLLLHIILIILIFHNFSKYNI